MDGLSEKFGSAQGNVSENKKRTGDGQAGPSTKKPKLDLPFLPHESMAGSETLQACYITVAHDCTYTEFPRRPRCHSTT